MQVPRNELPVSVAKVRDSQSGAMVYIVGCVHGTQVSASDVENVVQEVGPDVVVLELCEARLQQLRKRQLPSQSPLLGRMNSSGTYWGGPGPTALAIILTFVYRLQRTLGGEPGAEFKAAMAAANGARVVCGDAPASRTVRRLYATFVSPRRSLSVAGATVRGMSQRILDPSTAGINVPRVLLEGRRVRELARIFVPLLAAVAALSAVAGSGAFTLAASASSLGGGAARVVDVFDTLRNIADPLFTAYILLTGLHFVKVLVHDRDVVLARSIRKAARHCRRDSAGDVAIVAVLGLMHVNGVVRLLEKE